MEKHSSRPSIHNALLPFFRSLSFVLLSVSSLIRSFVRSRLRSFQAGSFVVRSSFVLSFVHLFIRPSVRSFIRIFIRSSLHWCVCLFIYYHKYNGIYDYNFFRFLYPFFYFYLRLHSSFFSLLFFFSIHS